MSDTMSNSALVAVIIVVFGTFLGAMLVTLVRYHARATDLAIREHQELLARVGGNHNVFMDWEQRTLITEDGPGDSVDWADPTSHWQITTTMRVPAEDNTDRVFRDLEQAINNYQPQPAVPHERTRSINLEEVDDG